jgi:hypothetical protein
MEKIKLTEEQRKQIIEETNAWIDENNILAMDILGLYDLVIRISFIKSITGNARDKYYYNKLRLTYHNKCKKYYQNKHKIEVNEELLGIKKKKRFKINKTL